MKSLKNLFFVALAAASMIACSEDESVQAPLSLDGSWVLDASGTIDLMEFTDGYIVYYANHGQAVTEALPYSHENNVLRIDGQDLTIKTLTKNRLTIIDADNNERIFTKNDDVFNEVKTNTFGNVSSQSVIARSTECEPATWTVTPVAEEVSNGGTVQLNVSKTAGADASIEVWLFTLPKTPTTAEQPYHLVSLSQDCAAGEAMVETQVTNASEGPAEIEVRLRRPTLNLQVGTQDFKIRVQE